VIHKIYKIRNKETGLFSKGGSCGYNIWTKDGKSWSNIGHLKSHLNHYVDYRGNKDKYYPYENAEIIEIVINYDECYKTHVNDLVDLIIEKKEKAQKEYEESQRRWQEEREKKQLAELKAKYESK
jgi:hypothetical protein